MNPDQFRRQYARVFDANERWNNMPTPKGDLYDWDENSTYIQEPPFFVNLSAEVEPIEEIHGRGHWLCWAIPSPRTTSPRPEASRRTAPPANTCRKKALRRRISTPTVPGAETTAS